MKTMFVLLVISITLIASFFSLNNRSAISANETKRLSGISDDRKAEPASQKNPVMVTRIDGERNPELISDETAYTLVFRLVGSYKNATERRSLSNYIKQNLDVTDNEDVEKIFALAQEFKQNMKPIDSQIDSIKEAYHLKQHMKYSLQDSTQLTSLKQQKDALVRRLIGKTKQQLRQSNKEKLNRAIEERVKTKITVKDPSTY